MTTLLRALACCVVLLLVVPARGEPPDEASVKAKRHFEEATKAFNLGEFPRAIREYRAAYNLKSEPAILYNLAQASRLAGDLPNAAFFYRSFLRNMPNTSNRREVEQRIRALEQQLSQQKALTTLPPNEPFGNSNSNEPPPVEPAPSPTPTTEPSASPRATPSATTTTTVAATAPAAATSTTKPIYKKAWFWGVIGGVVVVGVAIGVGVGVGLSSHAPSSHFGTMGVY